MGSIGGILLLLFVGLSLFVAVGLWASFRQEKERYTETLPESVVPVNLLDNSNAVVVAEGRGHLVFANHKARQWFNMDGSEPDLELMASSVQPAETFLELFGKEGQASFRIGSRRVEATSHYIPKQNGSPQTVVVMRELAAAVYDKAELDPIQAMNVVSEITQTISGSLKLNDTLESILNSIGSVIKFDIGEVTLWDEDLRILRPIGQSGESDYVEQFNSTDGVYHLDDSYSGWIARYRQPLLMTDVTVRPDVKAKLKDYPFTSYIGIPLGVGDRFIGTLELASRRRSAFDHEDMTLLQAIAGQAAIAIENARLYQTQSERLTELSGLQQIVAAMTSLADPHQMYMQLNSRIAGLMNVEMCGILLYDSERGVLISQPPFFGVPDAITTMYRIPIQDGTSVHTMYHSRDWWYTNNVKGDDLVRQLGLLNLAEAVGVRSTALAPMLVGTRRIGVVQASNKRDGSGFSENDVRLLSIFASQAAIVVENARLYDEEQRRADELGGLQQISQAIGVLRNINELYGQINERIAKLMNVQMCGILLYDSTDDQLSGQNPFYGVDEDLVKYYQLPVGSGGLVYDIYNKREFWLSNDLRADSSVRESGFDRLATLIGVRQTILVPLIVAGRRLGVVQVANKLNGGEFTEAESHVLSIFASQAAVIIDNSRLYQEMQDRASEAEGLRHIAEVASSNLTLDEIIKTIVADTVKLVACDVTAVGLLNEQNGTLTIRPEWTSGMESLHQPFSIDAYAADFQSSVVISRRLLMTNDLRSDGRVLPVYRALADRFIFDGLIQVPLVVRDRGIGEIILGVRGDHEFENDDVRLAQAVAAQLAAAVERSRLYETTDANLRARIQELDALTRVSNELNLTMQLERIIEVIRTEAQRTTGATAASIVLFKPAEQWTDPSQPVIDLRFGAIPNVEELTTLERNAFSDKKLTFINDYNETEGAEPQPTDARSAIVAPIKYSDTTTGLLHIYSDQPGAFNAQTEDFVYALTNQAAIAIGNATRYNEQIERSELLRQRADQLNQIFELGRTLRSGDTVESVLEAVAQGVTEAVGFRKVMISQPRNDGSGWHYIAQSGYSRDEFATKPVLGQGQIDAKLQSRYQLSGAYFIPAGNSSAREWQAGDVLLIPFRSAADQIIGLMQADEPRDGKRPTQQSVEALEIFASQAAFAIENSQLVSAYQVEAESTRRERDRLAQLHLVASEIQRAGDIPTRLQVVADGIRAAGWGRVAITLRDQNLEPRETITAGYDDEALRLYRANLLPGIVWQQRLADPDFRNFRVGQAYYLRHSDQWVTENKLVAGASLDANPGPRDRWHQQDTVYLPLYGLDRSRLIGIISMDSPADGKPPTEAGMRPIELFAVQASSAIENTRLYQETIRAAQQEARINEVMEAVSATLDLNEIITAVANGLQQMIAFTRMSVALADERTTDFNLMKVDTDLRGEITVTRGDPVPMANTALGSVYNEPVPRLYHLADAERTPDFADLKAWRESGERTTMIVPLVAGGRTLGALHMGSELVDAFGFQEQMPLVSRLGNLTAIAIENSRLFQQAIERERFSASLRRVGESVNAMMDMTGILQTVCEEAVKILNVETAYIMLREDDDLVGVASFGQDAERYPGVHAPLKSKDLLSVAVVRQKSALYVNDLRPDGPYRELVQGSKPAYAILGVPLLREDGAVGALMLVQTNPSQPFAPDDIEQASTFAFQASIAIENARLYQETLGLQSFNDAIIQSIQQGIVVLSRDLRIRTVNAFMRQNYGWEQIAVGATLFQYRPQYEEFLGQPIKSVLEKGQPEIRYGIDMTDPNQNMYIRNFYIYPLLERQDVNGIVLLVEDVTEQAALEADVEKRAEQLSVLTEVSGKLTATLEPNAVIELLLDQLARIIEFDNVVLWLRESSKLIIRAARGYQDASQLIGVEAEIADSELFREIASRGQTLNIPDVTQDPRFPMAEFRPVRSWLGISLVSKSNLTGLLVLEKEEIGFYTSTMEQLALTFANQAAIALENARLFQEASHAADENTRLYRETASRAAKLDQQAQRFSLLNRVSTSLAQSLDIENIFEVALKETSELLGVEHALAMMFEIDHQRARIVVEFPRGDMPPQNEFIPLESPVMEQIRQTSRPVVIADVQNDPNIESIRRNLLSQGILSTLTVPLTVSGQVIGCLSFDSIGERRDFAPEQVDLAQTIASQAAVAIQNANLFEQSVVRTRELETLFEATQSISVTLDLNEVMEKTARQMIFALQVENCLITSWDNVENKLIVELDFSAEVSIAAPAGSTYELSQFPVRERSLRQRQVILVRMTDPKLDAGEKKLLEARSAVSRMILPMIVREQAIGLIELETGDPGREFTATEVRLARTLASQAAIAIDNARLQTETASKLEELFVINELSTALASSIEQDQMFKIVRNRLPSLVKAQTLLVAVLGEDELTISYPVAVSNNLDMSMADHLLLDDEVSFIIKRRMPQFLAGDEMEGVLRNLQITRRLKLSRCFLGVPLIAGDQVLGAVALSDDRNPRAFTLDDQRILTTVAAQIAVALQNARLFARTRQFTSELEGAVVERTQELLQERDRIDFLYRITTGLTSSLDTDLVLTNALKMMAQSVDADAGAILGVDSISDKLVYRAMLNLPDREMREPLNYGPNEGLAGWVIQSQQSVIVPDVQADPRWLRMSELDDQPHSAMASLLEANEDILGVVMLYSNKVDQFNEAQLRLVTAAAKQVASAMNNAELYSLIREQAERLGAMVRREQVDATKNAAIVESIADGVMVADQSGDIVQFNSAAQRILGLTRQQVMNHHISDLAGLYAAGGGTRWLEAIEKWMADPTTHNPGENVDVQLHLDNERYVSVILSPVNMGDQFLGTVSVFRDITREIEVDKMKSEFVATVSHELRTPMTSIKGYADLLLLGAAGKINDQQQRFLSTIKSNADRLSILVNELLDISKIDRGTVRLSFQATDVTEIVEASVSHLQGRIENEKKDITFEISVPDDLPQIRADFYKLNQVLNNLLDNAFNYTYPGGKVTISACAEPRAVVISVSDTGVGIPKEKQDRIWNRFYRDEDQPLVMETSGTGLGLAIVKEYVKMHEGDIWLESEVGKGTTFNIRIPIYTEIVSQAQ